MTVRPPRDPVAIETLNELALRCLLATCTEDVAEHVRTKVASAERRILLLLIAAASVVTSWDLALWVHGR